MTNNESSVIFTPSPNNAENAPVFTPARNIEMKIMAARYKAAYEKEFALLDEPMQARVLSVQFKEFCDPAISSFIRRVVGLAESDNRI